MCEDCKGDEELLGKCTEDRRDIMVGGRETVQPEFGLFSKTSTFFLKKVVLFIIFWFFVSVDRQNDNF